MLTKLAISRLRVHTCTRIHLHSCKHTQHRGLVQILQIKYCVKAFIRKSHHQIKQRMLWILSLPFKKRKKTTKRFLDSRIRSLFIWLPLLQFSCQWIWTSWCATPESQSHRILKWQSSIIIDIRFEKDCTGKSIKGLAQPAGRQLKCGHPNYHSKLHYPELPTRFPRILEFSVDFKSKIHKTV